MRRVSHEGGGSVYKKDQKEDVEEEYLFLALLSISLFYMANPLSIYSLYSIWTFMPSMS